jgi:hypothetical protein
MAVTTPDTRTVAWDIESMIVAPLTSGDTPGTGIQVAGAVSASLEARIKSGEQPGDGGLYAVVAKMIGGTVTMQFTDLQGYEVIQAMTGWIPESSGTPQGLALPMGDKPFGYFYAAAKTSLDDGAGNLHMLLLKGKITGNFTLNVADGGFVVPQFTATLVRSNYIKRNGRGIFALPVRYASDVALAIPPTSVPLVA